MYDPKREREEKREVGFEIWRLKSQRKVVEFPCIVEGFLWQ